MRTLLIDGDILLYMFAIRAQQTASFPHGRYPNSQVWYTYGRQDKAEAELRTFLAEIMERLEADNYLIALSDMNGNFRMEVDPEYKANRSGAKRPVLFYHLRSLVESFTEAGMEPFLEGDDLLGIWATEERKHGAFIVCSSDKDLQTIPGKLYNWERRDEGVREISRDQADWYWLFQTLVGDSTDNYKGCPKVGPVNARRALAPYWSGEGETGEFDFEGAWEAVVERYRKAGLGTGVAVQNARLARILRAEDYVDGEVKLWEPR